MAEWVFTLTADNLEDERLFTFDHINGRTVRFTGNPENEWELIEGDWLDPGDNSLLGQIGIVPSKRPIKSHADRR